MLIVDQGARQELAHHLSAVSLISIIRDMTWALSDSFPDCSAEELK